MASLTMEVSSPERKTIKSMQSRIGVREREEVRYTEAIMLNDLKSLLLSIPLPFFVTPIEFSLPRKYNKLNACVKYYKTLIN